ncbi:hypothetical protein [Aurantibacillus circumpalustris]|uniref:hypothetical protein n=1 Tax=Aurantibacillus circumpalustris TaxID=3036359 RepID=UPI00295A7DA9|nr:hypothetical protein [Aurantibacillus circumpalustris]
MKRNLINEITAIRSRSEFYSRHDYSNRLNEIENAFNKNLNYNGDLDSELIKYIPIATIACFEAFFRSVYQELVDFGTPYKENAIKFNQAKNVKFDFEIINAIQDKTVTVGEFISHILPCNNFEDINTNLSTISGQDFLKSIKDFSTQTVLDSVNEDSNIFFRNYDQVIKDIKRTFELRHIFCHEFATNIKVEKDEILKCFNSSKLFLNQTNEFIWHLLYPNSPVTQTDLNLQASETFQKIESEFEELLIVIKQTSKNEDFQTFNPELFDETISEWKKYRKVKGNSDSSAYKEGSLHSLIYLGSLTTTTKEKIESLKTEFNITLRKNASY